MTLKRWNILYLQTTLGHLIHKVNMVRSYSGSQHRVALQDQHLLGCSCWAKGRTEAVKREMNRLEILLSNCSYPAWLHGELSVAPTHRATPLPRSSQTEKRKTQGGQRRVGCCEWSGAAFRLAPCSPGSVIIAVKNLYSSGFQITQWATDLYNILDSPLIGCRWRRNKQKRIIAHLLQTL